VADRREGGDPVQMYLADIYTIAVNLAGLPGCRTPAGFGATAAGRPAADRQLFRRIPAARVAHRYQQATDWHLRRPAIAA
jgi:aspartyl-tRNA(Asn)/glutamyl-tRNA(Gln) amidotransferase subunit A